MAMLKQIADNAGIAMLVVHHTRKASLEDFLDDVSGTRGPAGAADAILDLKRSRGRADAVLHMDPVPGVSPLSLSWSLRHGRDERDRVVGGRAVAVKLQQTASSPVRSDPVPAGDQAIAMTVSAGTATRLLELVRGLSPRR